jgi:ubiquinone/menaquinone biosynthesis C-methylase UbiE
MLAECFRVLKPGGASDFNARPEVSDGFAVADRTELQERYVAWMSRQAEGDAARTGLWF